MKKPNQKTPVAHWNYRIMRHKVRHKVAPGKTQTSYWYGLHEVYYKDGKPDGWTVEPKDVISTTEDETKRNDKAGADGVIAVLERMLADAKKSRGAVMNWDAKP